MPARGRRLLHLLPGLLGLLAGRVEPLATGGVVHRLAQAVERGGQRIGPRRELPFGLGGAGGVRRAHLPVPFALLLGQRFGFLAQVGQIALQRCAPEQLAAALECLPRLPLHLGEPLQRLLGPFGVEVLERLLQLLQSLAQLGRERAIELVPDLGQLALPRGVAQAGGLRALPERFQRLLQRLRLPHQLLLRLRDHLCLLRLLERE